MTRKTAPIPQTSQQDKKRKRLQTVGYVALIVLLLFVAAGGVFAKYVYSKANAGIVTAKEFYFASDKLSASGASYSLNPGTESIAFELRNHADSLRFSDVEIAYDVTVIGEGALISTPSGTLTAGKQSGVSIAVTGLQNGQTYTVIATGKAGYSETLTAKFTVLSADANVYKHLDISNSAFVVLTVWTENVSGDAVVTFPDGLIPDSTDPVLAGVQNYSDGSYIGASFTDSDSFTTNYASRTYRFFKETTSGSYNVGDFMVTVNGSEATSSTPK